MTGSTGPIVPSGDDVFGTMVDDDRLALIDVRPRSSRRKSAADLSQTMIDGLERIGQVWEVGKKVRFSCRSGGDGADALWGVVRGNGPR